jgi:hypothetical protein
MVARDLRVVSWETVPQRLKPPVIKAGYGTAEAVP